MNYILAAVASILTLLIIPLQADMVVAAASVAWGVALFAIAADALDAEDGLPIVRGVLIWGIALTGIFGAMAGVLGFLLCTTSLGFAALCVWKYQRHQIIS